MKSELDTSYYGTRTNKKGIGVGGENLHVAGLVILAETGVLAELGILPNTLASCFLVEDLRPLLFTDTGVDSLDSDSSS